MKKSLNYLPIEKRQELRTLTDALRETLGRNCLMVILYDRYAHGNYLDANPSDGNCPPEYAVTDYNLLILTRVSLGASQHTLYNRMRQHYQMPHTGTQFTICTIEQMNRGLAMGHCFFCTVKMTGKLLYDNGKYKLARRRRIDYGQLHMQGERYLDAKLGHARNLLWGAHRYAEQQIYDLAMFHLHQAAECYLNTIVHVFTFLRHKGHNLATLLKLCKRHTFEPGEALRCRDEDERQRFGILQGSYLKARYNDDFIVTRQDIDALMPRIESLHEITRRVCGERIADYKKLAGQ